MENNGHVSDRTATCLDGIRMSSHERLSAQRHLDAGFALADLALDLSRRARVALRAVGQRLGSARTQ